MWGTPELDAWWREDEQPAARERLTIRVRDVDGTTHVAVDGELDLATVHLLRRALYDAAWGPPEVRIDIRGATFMDLASLRVLLDARRSLAAQGRRLVVVVAPGRRPRVMTVLSLAAGLTVEEVPDDPTT